VIEQGEIVPSPLNGDVSSLLVHSVVVYEDMSGDELYHVNQKNLKRLWKQIHLHYLIETILFDEKIDSLQET
jgi:hypothetical protein